MIYSFILCVSTCACMMMQPNFMCAVTCAYVHMRISHVKVMCTYIYIQHHPSNIVTVMLHPTPAPHKPQSQRTQSYLSSVCFFLWFAVMVCCYSVQNFALPKTYQEQRASKPKHHKPMQPGVPVHRKLSFMLPALQC